VSIVKNVRGVCYVTTEQPYKKIVDLFSLYGIDTSTMQFIDATGGEGDAENVNVITIKNTPDDIKTTLDKVLKEKNINVVVIDNVSAVKLTKKFELPRFVQDMTLLIKANRSQGFFIGKTEDLGVQTMNDIAMFVDKVTGDVKW
jgi:KaiC/GvpD/RAD55 family RecA-like ATPase